MSLSRFLKLLENNGLLYHLKLLQDFKAISKKRILFLLLPTFSASALERVVVPGHAEYIEFHVV